ncbi:protein FAM200A-like, partial [Aphis craccivora]
VEPCAQLLVFARYVHSGVFKEEFIFCSPLETPTKATDILEKVASFFETENLSWNKLCGCCTDGAPAMMGSRSGFQVHVKNRSPNVKGSHCMIHRQALASKTTLEDEFERYFPEINGDELDLVRNPFRLQVEKIPDEYQDEFLELKMDSSAKDIFDEKSLTEFWPLMINSYPKVTEKALRALIPFVSTYLCESGFPHFCK